MKSSGTAGRSGDQVASYSSKGPTLFDHIVKPDIVAPGNHVISVLGSPGATLFGSIDALAGTSYTNCGSCTWTSTHYFYLSGTSMATPVVSGAAALVLQQNPWMTPDQVKARLMKTSYKSLPRWSWAQNSDTGQWYENQDDVFTVGAGYLDVQAALQNNDLAPWYVGSAMSPVVNTNWWGGTYLVPSATVIGGNSVLWGSTQVFGQSVLWGTLNSNQSLLSLVSSVTGSSVLWGSVDSAVLGSSVLWGSLNNASDNSQSIEVAGEN
jgi:serine protease AprX